MNEIFYPTNLENLCKDIYEPLKQTSRIKYTCFDASYNFCVFGATSGSLYVFQRYPCKFLYLVPTLHGPINNVSISPSEVYVAFTTNKGTICLCRLSMIRANPNITFNQYDKNVVIDVTYLYWKDDENQFYYGDKNGTVFLVLISTFMRRTVSNINIYPILYLEAPIVQICNFENFLLVSNNVKCILCNIDTEGYKQIGSRPRDGQYGATFLPINRSELTDAHAAKIFCARPGLRLWEVDFHGNVVHTHKITIDSIAPSKVFNGIQTTSHLDTKNALNSDNNHLANLQIIFNNYILAYSDSMFLIYDPESSSVILWNDEFSGIKYIKLINTYTILIWTNQCEIYTMKIYPLDQLFIQFVIEASFILAADCLLDNIDYFLCKCKTKPELSLHMKNLCQKLRLYDENQRCESILNTFSEYLNETMNRSTINKHLDEGIYMVENSFCDELKYQGKKYTPMSSNQSNVKKRVMITTITEKMGKNVLNKLNIFNENTISSTKKNSLAKHRTNHVVINKSLPVYPDISNFSANSEIVPQSPTIIKWKNGDNLKQLNELTAEEKLIRNLFMIYKAAKISTLTLVDRYADIFDQYDSPGIIKLLKKLQQLMIENGEANVDAQKNCIEFYFNYLNGDIVWEMDDRCRDYIYNGFICVNKSQPNTFPRCKICAFPLLVSSSSVSEKYNDIGIALMKYFWARNRRDVCYELVTNVPYMMDSLCKFLIGDNEDPCTIVRIIFAIGNQQLLEWAGNNYFNTLMWQQCFDLLKDFLIDHIVACLNCNYTAECRIRENNNFYSWNNFANILYDNVKGKLALEIIDKYSCHIKSDEIQRKFYIKCLLE